MDEVIETRDLTKRFGGVLALDGVTLSVPPRALVGLVGRNGSGKTTLLRHFLGLQLPSSGECRTLGRSSDRLGPDELSRIGAVHQENRLLGWMSVEQHLAYVASFYERWDRVRADRLLRELDLDRRARVGALSPGNVQKLALVLAVCHHPRLLLLDEPVSGVDPIAREELLRFLVDMLQEDALTVVVSSHVLRDVERVVDWILCLERGRVVECVPYDELQERYAEWEVTPRNGGLPGSFGEPFVLSQTNDRHRARLLVQGGDERVAEFQAKYRVDVVATRLNLERIFPFLIGRTGR